MAVLIGCLYGSIIINSHKIAKLDKQIDQQREARANFYSCRANAEARFGENNKYYYEAVEICLEYIK